jgi:hypothetical protein
MAPSAKDLISLNALFAQLANTLHPQIADAQTFLIRLFGHHSFSFHLSPNWPHQDIRTALFNSSDLISNAKTDWKVFGLSLSSEQMAELVRPYDCNRYGQIIAPGLTTEEQGAATQLAFYDPFAKTLRAYDFDHRIAYVLVCPGHIFAEWEIFSPLKEFWHYWALFNNALLVHSGVVCQSDQALVILGPGGVGKSTTTLSCVEYGMQTTGDDFNLLSMTDGHIWVYPLFTTVKTKVGNPLINTFNCLNRWTSQDYGAKQKMIYFPKSDDSMWQTTGAEVLAFMEPYWQTQEKSTTNRATPAMQSTVSAVLQHPYLGERYLQRAKAMLALCPSHAVHLSAQPLENVTRIRALWKTLGQSQ